VTTQLPAGPYRTLTTPEGGSFPYYIIPFDADGVCSGPLTRTHLIEHLQGVTDIFLFSHGWNNDWSAATKRYEEFITGFQALRASQSLPMPADYKPLLVGVFWPSQSLTLFESETGPGFASTSAVQDADVGAMQGLLTDIAAQLPPASRARFHTLASAEVLNTEESSELAALLAGVLRDVTDAEAGNAKAPSADDLLASADALTAPEPDYDAVGAVRSGPASTAPMAAGGIGGLIRALDPRNLLKPFTVWQMKDRAGKVGAIGVAPLLNDLLTSSDASARVHLLGHSYGCKVVMTATCMMQQTARKVESALLLQPAISRYAFAESVPEQNVPGGFFRARDRVRLPIVATFSTHDKPLHDMFHLSVRRHDDLGELQYAGGDTPSKYAALGGYGPGATTGATIIAIRNPGSAYTLPPAPAVVGIEGSRVIDGHGGILNDDVWYLSWTLATAHMRP
jgi:pimeloyl-ACP methyl ester carboxylesterase